MTTIKELCEKYDVNLELPEEINTYDLEIPITNITGHHTEQRDGRTIQVFSGEFKDEEIDLEYEYILDNEAEEPALTYLSQHKGADEDEPMGFHQITWHKDGTVTDSIQ